MNEQESPTPDAEVSDGPAPLPADNSLEAADESPAEVPQGAIVEDEIASEQLTTAEPSMTAEIDDSLATALDDAESYEQARRFAEAGDYDAARERYQSLAPTLTGRLAALVRNDLATISAVEGDLPSAKEGFAAALALDAECLPARMNLAMLQADEPRRNRLPTRPSSPVSYSTEPGPIKVAILSFLFNWPSTGGGIIHTVELAQFLSQAGFDVKHIFARLPDWGIGKVDGALPYASEPLDFDGATWNRPGIQHRFRQAVDRFDPDHVIITDSWNFKPLLAEAVRDYPYILRFQAMECLCPLNNVRLLIEDDGRIHQCGKHQLATPAECHRCIAQRGRFTGALHQAERALSGVGSPEYDRTLRRAVEEAEAVFVVNPAQQIMFAPYAKDVRVAPSGMDPARFPWPWPDEPADADPNRPKRLLFAGLVEELMKGFEVLREACRLLWQRRQDFELVVTSDPPQQIDPFARYIGWQSQEALPREMRQSDICIVPTVAQEALGRTAVEAMAVGKSVIASRLGGLPYTVADTVTGLLCEPGDPVDLANKIETLLEDPSRRHQMGLAGRKRFEEHFAWPVILEKDYFPILSKRKAASRQR